MSAVVLYANEHKGYLPFPNSIVLETPPGAGAELFWRGPGWLYQAPLDTSSVESVKGGALWPYLRTVEIYHCPGDPWPRIAESSNVLSSYMMNGAVCGFNKLVPAHKLTRMKPNWICFVEADHTDDRFEPTWDDGYVDPDDGCSERHKLGANVACFDTHVEWISHADFDVESERKPSRVWCNPGTTTGE
jgi:hypothetical protein